MRLLLDGAYWSTAGGSRARGYAHLRGRFLDADGIARAAEACDSDEAWTSLVASLNGCFALVSERETACSPPSTGSARSRCSTQPVPGGISIADDAHRLAQPLYTLDEDSVREFRLTGYVTGAQTLVAGVRQLEAGTWIRARAGEGRVEASRYHAFTHGNFLDEPQAALIDRLDSLHRAVFQRVVESAQGRPIVVPLSGGYDSRLIGVSLRDLGVRDVICYTYGTASNWETRISRELADYLGFRWEFVPYTAERWRRWAATEAFRAYFHAAGNLASVPHLQDWPAVHELLRERRIANDSVIVPGHSGDFLAGSHVPKAYATMDRVGRRAFLDSLASAHYTLWDVAGAARPPRDFVDRRIEAVIGPSPLDSREAAADAFERWDLQERQAKFICNSMRVYEQAGLEWRLPLFDAELMDFWARIPVDLRLGRRLYFAFAEARQVLPITPANTDYTLPMRAAIRAMDALRLRPLAERARRAVRRARWRVAYEQSPLAWPALVDTEQFRRTYTGRENMHAYMALRYLDHVSGAGGG